jgi:hypothetical protein
MWICGRLLTASDTTLCPPNCHQSVLRNPRPKSSRGAPRSCAPSPSPNCTWSPDPDASTAGGAQALNCVAAGRVGAYGVHRLMTEEEAENTKKLKALEAKEAVAPTDSIVSFITTAFFGTSEPEARAPAAVPCDYAGVSAPNGVLDSMLYALAEGCDTGDLRGQTVPALAVLVTLTAYEVRPSPPLQERVRRVGWEAENSGAPEDSRRTHGWGVTSWQLH